MAEIFLKIAFILAVFSLVLGDSDVDLEVGLGGKLRHEHGGRIRHYPRGWAHSHVLSPLEKLKDKVVSDWLPFNKESSINSDEDNVGKRHSHPLIPANPPWHNLYTKLPKRNSEEVTTEAFSEKTTVKEEIPTSAKSTETVTEILTTLYTDNPEFSTYAHSTSEAPSETHFTEGTTTEEKTSSSEPTTPTTSMTSSETPQSSTEKAMEGMSSTVKLVYCTKKTTSNPVATETTPFIDCFLKCSATKLPVETVATTEAAATESSKPSETTCKPDEVSTEQVTPGSAESTHTDEILSTLPDTTEASSTTEQTTPSNTTSTTKKLPYCTRPHTKASTESTPFTSTAGEVTTTEHSTQVSTTEESLTTGSWNVQTTTEEISTTEHWNAYTSAETTSSGETTTETECISTGTTAWESNATTEIVNNETSNTPNQSHEITTELPTEKETTTSIDETTTASACTIVTNNSSEHCLEEIIHKAEVAIKEELANLRKKLTHRNKRSVKNEGISDTSTKYKKEYIDSLREKHFKKYGKYKKRKYPKALYLVNRKKYV